MPKPEPTLDPSLFAANRRTFVKQSLCGMGSLALAHLLEREAIAAGAAPKGKARAVICLFQHGGPSQMDLFDPKPVLNQHNGKKFDGDLEVHFVERNSRICLGTPHRFEKRGQSGLEISEVLPHIASIADDITLVRSMMTDSVDHEAALRLIHCGQNKRGRPVWGSWVLYGLGSERKDLPAYVVLTDPAGNPTDGPNNWSSGFLPAQFQGTPFRAEGEPVVSIAQPKSVSAAARDGQLGFLKTLNQIHLGQHPRNTELGARLGNYELAARMQTSVPEAVDLTAEPKHIRDLYGLDNPATAEYGRRCLIARRLVERGVPFVQLYLHSQPWDTHDKNAENVKKLGATYDQPSAALVKDLKQRGLLDSTIVFWGGEFGRQPVTEGATGRDHNRQAFSLWLAGGGFKGGYVHGATDDFGAKAVKDPVSPCDLHATLLRALGLDHVKLTYPHEGRDDSLTDVTITKAKIVQDLLV